LILAKTTSIMLKIKSKLLESSLENSSVVKKYKVGNLETVTSQSAKYISPAIMPTLFATHLIDPPFQHPSSPPPSSMSNDELNNRLLGIRIVKWKWNRNQMNSRKKIISREIKSIYLPLTPFSAPFRSVVVENYHFGSTLINQGRFKGF